MKCLIFAFLLLLIPIVTATSIALSPASIPVTGADAEYSFILINPNNYGINYTITTTSANIQLQDSAGTIDRNSDKQIQFKASSLKQDEYIIISFDSGTLSPTLTLKLIKVYNKTEQAASPAVISLQSQQQVEEKHEDESQNTEEKDSPPYLLLAVIILLVIIMFSISGNGKYRTGHTGQVRRMFIKKFLH